MRVLFPAASLLLFTVVLGQNARPNVGQNPGRPMVATKDLYGQWEGRIAPLPGQLPKMPTPNERTTSERGARLVASVKVFVRFGPSGACKLATNIVGGPSRTEVARWSLVGQVLKIDRPAFKGRSRPSLLGIVAPTATGGAPTKFIIDLPGASPRLKGRITLVRTGYPVPAVPATASVVRA